MSPREVFKPVPECWYGNYKIESDKRYENILLVTVRLCRLFDGKYRVCVWGDDDLGMERDFLDPVSAIQTFSSIVLEESLTRSLLETKYTFIRA